MHAKRCSESWGGNGGEKSVWTLLSFLFLFEGAVGRAEWLSEHQMNAGIHAASEGFQHPFKPRALLERAPKALCRGPWEGSSCLEYLSQHGERGSFVPGSHGQGESPGEKKEAFRFLQQRFAGSRARGGRSPSAGPAAPRHLSSRGTAYVMLVAPRLSLGSGVCLRSLHPGVEVCRQRGDSQN